MIHIEDLKKKDLAELNEIATELGIDTKKMNQQDLIYAIIDKSASLSAAQKASSDKPKKRQRIKAVDHVYSADQLNAKKIDKPAVAVANNSLFNDLSFEDIEILDKTEREREAAAKQQKAEEPKAEPMVEKAEEPAVETPKKKRGRPRKTQEEEAVETVTSETKAAAEPVKEAATEEPVAETPKKKRGRPRKTQEPIEEDSIIESSLVEVESESNTQMANAEMQEVEKANNDFSVPTSKAPLMANEFDDGSDFIILEDIPKEDIGVDNQPISFFDKYKNDQKEEEPARTNIQEKPFEQVNFDQPAEEEYEDDFNEPYDLVGLIVTSGVLDVANEGYGFLRSSDYNYLSSPDDIYINQSQIKHYGLKTGDIVEGAIRPPREGEKFFPMVRIDKINGCDPSVVRDRVPFEYLTPLFPDEKFTLCSGKNDSPTSRIVDLFAPIGKGQRALIVAQPKTGKTMLMKDIANSISRNHPEAYLMMLLIDERPEEVTDMARTVNAEVIASTFDAPAENHVKIANLVLEKAKRMVECGHDVVIFLDSITRLARAYNTVSPASGKVLTGGVDANALQKPKRFFGAARNIEGGGSLTIIATALVDTGSKMDEVIFEEFKGTGNSEIQLDRALSNKRVFPSINLIASSTRRDDLLQDQYTIQRMWVLRKHLADMTNLESMDLMLNHISRTVDNQEFLATMNG